MKSIINPKKALITIGTLEIVLALISIIVYSSVFSFIPWYNMISLKTLLLIAFFFLLLLISVNYVAGKITIPDENRMITISLALVSFISIVLIEIWNYQYSLVRIIAICNLAFYFIVLCETCIYTVSLFKGNEEI